MPPDYLMETDADQPVCGVDEVGRGPWAGPVVAAAVMLDPACIPEGIDDSKKLSKTPSNDELLEVRPTDPRLR